MGEIQVTVFRWINARGAETENEPLTSFDFNETHSWTPEYLNIKCWKYDLDRMNSSKDMACQSKKSGACLFKQARLFGKIRYIAIMSSCFITVSSSI